MTRVELKEVPWSGIAGCLTFLWHCYRAYRRAGDIDGIYYFKISRYQVPDAVVMIGRGRNAYTVADFATNFFAERR